MESMKKMVLAVMVSLMVLAAPCDAMADVAENAASTTDSFETTDKVVDDVDSVTFEDDTPDATEEETEVAEDDTTDVSNEAVDAVPASDNVVIDESIEESDDTELVISIDSEVEVATDELEEKVIIDVVPAAIFEEDATFETTDKVVDEVEIINFESEPEVEDPAVDVEGPVDETPEAEDLTSVIVIPETPVESEIPTEPEKPTVPVTPEAPEVTVTPEEPVVPEAPTEHRYHDNDSNDNYERTKVVTAEVVVTPFVARSITPVIIDMPTADVSSAEIIDVPTPYSLPKTGDKGTPTATTACLFSLLGLILLFLKGNDEAKVKTRTEKEENSNTFLNTFEQDVFAFMTTVVFAATYISSKAMRRSTSVPYRLCLSVCRQKIPSSNRYHRRYLS